MSIRVNGVEISDEELHQEMQFHPADSLEQAQQKAAHALIIRLVLLQQAKNQKLINTLETSTPEEQEKAIEQLLKQSIVVPEADTETCHQYYLQNKQRFIDKTTGRILPLASVNSIIVDYLHTRSLRTGIVQFIQVLIREAHIVGIDFDPLETSLF